MYMDLYVGTMELYVKNSEDTRLYQSVERNDLHTVVAFQVFVAYFYLLA